jgi:hypothetical protein
LTTRRLAVPAVTQRGEKVAEERPYELNDDLSVRSWRPPGSDPVAIDTDGYSINRPLRFPCTRSRSTNPIAAIIHVKVYHKYKLNHHRLEGGGFGRRLKARLS